MHDQSTDDKWLDMVLAADTDGLVEGWLFDLYIFATHEYLTKNIPFEKTLGFSGNKTGFKYRLRVRNSNIKAASRHVPPEIKNKAGFLKHEIDIFLSKAWKENQKNDKPPNVWSQFQKRLFNAAKAGSIDLCEEQIRRIICGLQCDEIKDTDI